MWYKGTSINAMAKHSPLHTGFISLLGTVVGSAAASCILAMIAVFVTASCVSVPEEPAAAETSAGQPVPPVIESIPEEEDVYTTMSEAMLLGDVDEAIDAFEEAYTKNPEDTESKTLYANLLMIAGKIEEARAILQEVLTEEPENTEALFNLALVDGISGDRENQEKTLLQIVKLDPQHAQAHASLGELRLAAGTLDAAKESFQKALAADAENMAALIGYGNVLIAQGEAAPAVEQFDKVLAMAPDYAFAYVDRSRAKRDAGDLPGAEKDLTEAIRLNPDFYWHYIDRGRLRLLHLGDTGGALEDFNQAIEIDPDFFYAYVFRGGMLDQAGDIQTAADDYVKVLEARPDYYHLYGPAGVLLYAGGRFREARRYLKLAYDYEKDEHFWAFLIALSYKREGLDGDLEAYLKKAITRFPQDALYYRLARVFFEPSADAYVTAEVAKEQDHDLKLKGLFVLATYYLIEEKPALAQKYFLEVENKAYPSSYEGRLSSLELERFRGKGGEE